MPFSCKNRGEKRFIIKHENIIFQDMLLSPPQQKAQNGGSEWGNYHNIRYFIGGVYDSFFLQKYLLNINIYYYIYLYLEEKFAYWYSVS